MNWPSDRPVTYDADLNWDEEGQEWISDYLINPGNYSQYLVTISENGSVYFGSV
jgi:hypothetical protein